MNFFHTSFNLRLINTHPTKPKFFEEITLLLFLIRIINTILEEYKYHSSVLAIRKHSEQANFFSFSEMTTTDVLKLIKRIHINKVMGEDQTPPKLIKTAGGFLVDRASYRHHQILF